MFPSAHAVFMIPKASPWASPTDLCPIRDERHAGRVEAAERDRGEHDQHDHGGGSRANGERERDRDRRGESEPDRQEAAVAVGEPTEQRVDGRLGSPRPKKTVPIAKTPSRPRRASAGRAQQQAEEERGEHVEPEPAEEPRSLKASSTRRDSRSPLGAGARPPRRRVRARPRRPRRRCPDADLLGDCAEHRPDDRAEHGGAERDADQLAAPRPGRLHGQPGERAGPGHRAREALDEAGDAERPRPSAAAKREARECEQHEPGENGALRPELIAASPPGMPPSTAPAPKAPTSSPAPAFESPNSSA